MGILDKIPFLGRKSATKASLRAQTYVGKAGKFKQTYPSQLKNRIEELSGENTDVNTRIWDDLQGLEVDPAEGDTYLIKMHKDGEVNLEISEGHPLLEKTIDTLEGFFDVDFELRK